MAAACSDRRAGSVAAAGGMKAPRRPRQTLLLPRLCVGAAGLLAAVWVFHLSEITGALRMWCLLVQTHQLNSNENGSFVK